MNKDQTIKLDAIAAAVVGGVSKGEVARWLSAEQRALLALPGAADYVTKAIEKKGDHDDAAAATKDSRVLSPAAGTR